MGLGLYKNWHTDWIRKGVGDAGILWKALASLQAVLSVWLAEATQHAPSITLLCLAIWGGAAVCAEDILETLEVRPSQFSLITGMTLLTYVGARSITTLDKDTGIYVLPVLAGTALACLVRPIPKIRQFRESLTVLALFPLQEILTRILPDFGTSVLTGKISEIFLVIFGVDAVTQERFININGKAVYISGACNSVDQIALTTVICIVFTLAFPVRSLARKILFIMTAPIAALCFNAARIAILAAINASTIRYKGTIFDFLHDEWGALVFGSFAVIAMGQAYLMMVEQDLKKRES